MLEGASVAHEGHEHGHEKADAQMAKLHKMMPRYQSSQQAIKTALEKGDVATIEKETAYLLSTIPDLKKSKPHKRVKEVGDFRAIADRFRKDIESTVAFAQKGDLGGAKASFSDAQKQCNACHTKFRD
jgi:soluble cytochrome b562